MKECICSSCKNLKGIIGDAGDIREYGCGFGFPSDRCGDCEVGACEEDCAHYISDADEDALWTVRCSGCGKELKTSAEDVEEESVFCIDCYLGKKD